MAALSVEKGPLFKVILLGEAGVGKTSIFYRAKENSFLQHRKNTVGIDSFSMYIKVGDQQATLGVWDTAGVERFRTITNNYYRGSHAAIFVYSMDDPSSLHYLAHWLRDLNEYSPEAMKILVGNKKDLECEISKETIELFRNANECHLSVLTSAKTGEGIQDMFDSVAQMLVGQGQHKLSSTSTVSLDSPHRRSGCCS